MSIRATGLGLVGLVFVLAACGDDGSGGSGAGNVSGDPGREVEGCFDCTETEYCLIISGETEDFHCAEAACGIECDCIMDDSASRLEICQAQFSCQEGSGLMYCYEE